MTRTLKTQVCIIGSGPAGLLLSQLLHTAGVDSIIVDRQSREHIEGRIRAGVLEAGSVATLIEAGAGERLQREGLLHDGFDLAFGGERHRIDLKGLTGKQVTVYGQTEVTRDLIELRLRDGGPIIFSAERCNAARCGCGQAAGEFRDGWRAARDRVRFHCRVRWLSRGLAQDDPRSM
jgi:p-hydroxybenzoate 3-monooxygenase